MRLASSGTSNLNGAPYFKAAFPIDRFLNYEEFQHAWENSVKFFNPGDRDQETVAWVGFYGEGVTRNASCFMPVRIDTGIQ